MKKIIIFLVCIYLNAGVNYKIHKTIQLLNEFSSKNIQFLPIDFYNIFPVNIDKPVNLDVYLKKQSLVINLRAIGNNSAFINGKWYNKGDKIQNLTIYKITNRCVFFKTFNPNIAKKTFSVCITPNLIKVGK